MADTPPNPVGQNPIYGAINKLSPVNTAAPITSLATKPIAISKLAPVAPRSAKEKKIIEAYKNRRSMLSTAGTIPGRVLTEAKGFMDVTKAVPSAIAHLAGGFAVDIGEIVYQAVPFNAYRAPDPKNTTYGRMGIDMVKSAMLWKTIPEYLHALENKQAVTPLILRDAGNLSIMFHGLGAVAKASAVAATEKAAARAAAAEVIRATAEPGLAAEAASAVRGETVIRDTETRSAIERAQRLAAKSERSLKVATVANRFGTVTGPALHYADVVGASPFKPYIYAGKQLGSLVRNGVYLGGNYGWGRRAAEGYMKQLEDLRIAEPDISLQDERVVDLLKKISINNRIGLSQDTRSTIRQAVRNANHEKSAMARRVLNESEDPLYRDEINPDTNKPWGTLNSPEQEAIIAVINGRAQLIRELSRILEITPEEVSKLGRFDATPEYYLSPEGARLAMDFLDSETSGISQQQYDRLGRAVDNIVGAIHEATIQAVNGEGRRNALSPEYLQPVPFAKNVLRAIDRYASEEVKTIADAANEAGVFELPVDHPTRIKVLQLLVDQLPDEIALDPAMYPANMRENIEFYRRVRRTYNREVTGGAAGEPIPPRNGGPRAPENPWYPFEGEVPEGPEQFRTTAGRGKLNAVSKEVVRTKRIIQKLSSRVLGITDKIEAAEEKYAKIIDRVKKYDIIDAYVEGKSVKWIAKKFRISVADVQAIIDKSPVAKAADRIRVIEERMAQLEKIIGKKRATLEPGALDEELIRMTQDLVEMRKEAQDALASYEAARNINEVARQADESATARTAKELDRLDDELMDAETALENVGGDPQALKVQVDSTDPIMGPVTIEIVRAQLRDITEFVDNEVIPAMTGNVPDQILESMGRISTLLKGVWDQAENSYFDATTPEQVASAAARLEQLGNYIYRLNERLNETSVNPPDGVPVDTALADVLMQVVTDKQSIGILTGQLAPTSVVTGGKTTASPGSAGTNMARVFRSSLESIKKGYGSGSIYTLTHNVEKLLYFNKNDVGSKILDTIIDDFGDPSSLPNPKVYTYRGDTLRIATAINQLSRWLREVIDAKTDQQKIDLILNPPDYVPRELSDAMLRGVSRSPERLGKEFYDSPAHPLSKFPRKISEYLDGAINDIVRIHGHIDEFGTATHVDWSQLSNARTYSAEILGESYTQVVLRLPNVKGDGVVPKISFISTAPKEVILQAIDALRMGIETGARADNLTVDSMIDGKESQTGWFVGLDGLTKKLSKQKEIALKDLADLRAKVEAMPEIDGQSLVATGRGDRLPGVVPADAAPSVSPRSPSSNQPTLKAVEPATGQIVESPLRAAEQPGSYELHPDQEFYADILSKDPQLLEEWRATRDDAVAYEQSLEEARNPSPEELKQYKASVVKAAEDTVYEMVGYATATFPGEVAVDPKTGMPRFPITPMRTPEWDWWWKLDAKFRRKIARDYFTSTELKSGAAKGPRYVRKAGSNIDSLADAINGSVDEAAQKILEIINEIERAKRDLRSARDASIESLAEEYSKSQLNELERYASDFEASAREYNDIVSRAEYKAGLESTSALPAEVRPTADNPSMVRVDRSLADTSVRDAAYEADVIDAMAKQATNAMKKAQRLTDKIKALEQFIEESKKYRAEVDRLLSKKRAAEKARLSQIKNEERQAALRERRKTQQGKLREAKKTLKYLETHPGTTQIGKLTGNVPLRVALEAKYPTDIAGLSVEVPIGEPGVTTPMDVRGPMYVPTGRPAEFQGGISKEVTREGLDGFRRLTSDHYRDGDRHTIFSVRLLAKRLGEEAGRIRENEAFRAIVAHFGHKPVDLLGEEAVKQMWQNAYERASAMPESELLDTARAIADQAAAIGESPEVLAGIDAYSMGVPNPKIAFDLAVKEFYGQLLAQEMAFRGLEIIDPYGTIESVVRNSRITHESMFVPKYLRESMANVRTIIDPSSWNAFLRGANTITRVFKTTTLVLSVPWQLGDLISNVVISHMSGVKASDLIARMRQVVDIEYGGWRQMGKQLWNPTEQMMPPPAELAKIAMESPVQDISLALEERRVLQGLKPLEAKPSLLKRLTGKEYPQAVRNRGIVKLSFKLNETLNRISRHAYFLEKLEKTLAENGVSLNRVAETGEWRKNPQIKTAIEEAADSANQWLGDYANLSMRERKYLTPFIPFYAWTKHIHQVFYALGKEHPQSLRWYVTIGALHFDPNEDPMGLRYGGLGLFGGTVSTNFLNPLGDVASGALASYIVEGDVRPALQQLGAPVRLASGLLFGMDISKLGAIQRPAGSGNYGLTGQMISTPLLRNPSEALGFTLQQFPITQRILNVLPPGNIPGTRIATGSFVKYPTGEARLKPYTQQRIPKWGGQLAAVGRLFSLPGIPTQADQQIADIEAAAKRRLRTVQTLKKRRAKAEKP